MKKIPHLTSKQVIGQSHIMKFINNEIDNANYHIEKGLTFIWRPKLLGGPAGTGKGTIAEAFAEVCFPNEQYIVFPPNGGIGDMKELASKIASTDDDGSSAIPAVILYDECQVFNKTAEEIIKLLINKPVGSVVRTGKTFYHDQRIQDDSSTGHKIFFASNEVVDKAIVSRCDVLETSYYSDAEKEKHFNVFLKKPMTDEALEYCVSRVKPIGRDIQAIITKLDQCATNKLTIEHARLIVKDMFGLNPGGIERKDMKIMKRLCEGQATIDVLKWSAGDQMKKQTKERCDWLTHLMLIEPSKHNGFVLTKKGAAYYDDTMKKIREQKAKKATAKK